MNKRIERFVKKSYFSERSRKLQRMRDLKKMILNMPYTKTYHVYKTNQGSFFDEADQEALRLQTGDSDN